MTANASSANSSAVGKSWTNRTSVPLDLGREATLDALEPGAAGARPWMPGFAAVATTAPVLPCRGRALDPRPAPPVAAPLPGPPAGPPEPVWPPRFPREDDEPLLGTELPGADDGAPVSRETGDEEVRLPLAGEPECEPPPSGVLTGGSETRGVLTDGVVMLGVVTRGVVTGPTVIDGAVTEGVLSEGTVTVGTVTVGTATVGTVIVGTLTVGTDSAGPAAIAAPAAPAGTSSATHETRTRSRIRLMARAIDHPTAYRPTKASTFHTPTEPRSSSLGRKP